MSYIVILMSFQTIDSINYVIPYHQQRIVAQGNVERK